MKAGPSHVQPLVHFRRELAVALHGAEGCVLNVHVLLAVSVQFGCSSIHSWAHQLLCLFAKLLD